LDAATALEIINEYNSGFEETEAIPESEDELIEKGLYLYTEAKKGFHELGIKNNTLQTILFIGSAEEIPGKNVADSYPRRSSGGLSESDERETVLDHTDVPVSVSDPLTVAQSLVLKENLPMPPHMEGDPEEMPSDFSKVADKQIRKLSGIYNAYLGRVTYLLGVATTDLMNAEHLFEHAKNKALRGLDTEKKLAKIIEAEVAADVEVSKWSDSVSEHQKEVTMLKALKEIYSGNVERLSREWTMRQNEWEKTR
jgi:hypothetical protein